MTENTNIFDADSGEFRPLGGPVSEDAAGLRVDGYLSTNFPFYSRATWQRKLSQGRVLIDGVSVKPSYRIHCGQVIEIYHPRQDEPEVSTDISPIWKKGNVMAVFKPGNLPMHENGPYRKNTFAHLVTETFGEGWAAVHRLDRETSGIVLCGKTHDVRQRLSRSLESRTLGKEYTAIVKGVPKQPSWTIEGPIGDLEDSKIRIKKWVVPDGQSAETDFMLEESAHGYSMIKAYPKTGRTHQIRIHAAYSGHALVGDITYHPDESVFLEWFESGKTDWVKKSAGFDRCLLHATSVTFVHPETEELCRVACPVPDDMMGFWRSLTETSNAKLRI
ncbi:MAG: RluA family pseudouridine synthase [Pseudobacteriovorax sp.]|nr:RluA family pseudouridine synthase [Pseudobacteriovorax sp.]